jgi:DHA1 family multidrug resistance protein-like MFS transporter
MESQPAQKLIAEKSPFTGFIESVVPSRLNTGAKLFLTGALINGLSNGIFNSVMQLYLVLMGFSAVELGQMFMFNPLATALFSIPCGIAADRYGKRKMMLLGFASVLIGISLFFFAETIPWFASAFFMFGISNATSTVLTPLYTSFYEKHDMEKAFGLFGLLNIAAMSLGSLAGYLPIYLISNVALTEFSSYRVVMIIGSVLFVAQYVFFIGSSNGLEEKLKDGFHFKLDSWRPVMKFSVLSLFGNIAGGMLFSLFPYYVYQKFSVDSAGLGTLFFLSNLSMALSKGVAASIAKRLGNMKSIVVGLFLSSVFFFLMPLSPSFGLLCVLYVLRSGTRFMSDPILTSFFMKSINEDEQSTANSIRTISMNGGGVVSPWLGGTLMDNVSLDFPAYLGAGLTVVLATLYPLLLRREINDSGES